MLDTGNAGATIIEDYWAAPLGLTAGLAKGSPRGDARYSSGTIGLGPFTLPGEVVSYYGPAERGSEYTRAVAGIYGEPLLSRFDAAYDYSRGLVWLDPVAEAQPVPFDRSGLSLAKTDGGAFAVSAVPAGSPAEAAGFKKGDVVDAVDGRPAPTLSRADAAALLRGNVGTRIVLRGRFGGEDGSRTLVLRDLVRK
jgi:S1-C subfamily serine protease